MGGGLTSGPIQYDPIQYSLCFFRVQIFVAQRGRKKQPKRTWINNSSDPVTLHELKVCATVCRELGWQGLTGVSRYNTAIYGSVWMLQAPDRLHHQVEGTDVFFSDAVAQTKKSRDCCFPHGKDGEKLSKCLWTCEGKGKSEVLGSDFFLIHILHPYDH